ncbi:MAG TPA: UrcA family protein [Caulobacteraceae bacterium]|nr:UrcA family protein [Caulobacteraceae bacterium]
MSHRFLLAAAIVSIAAIATPVPASPASSFGEVVVVTRVVRYREAELHTPGGARSLAVRLKSAAEYVCGGDDILVRFYDRDFIACRESAIDRALATLQAPMVSAALGRISGEGLSSTE